ncbi:ankyrin repeat-containing domain protein [Zopfochytrium polystomum]|nr:ankyrin repeat-containing domain protein [Zopfochytrium polystomum]
MNLPACVAVLLDHGADVTIASSKGVTALHAACREALPEMAALLLDRGAAADARAHDGTPAILDAAAAGSTECVRLLLDRGAAADSAANPDRFDRTPLLASLWAENIDCVRLLLTRGADPNGILGGGGDVPDMRAILLHVAAMQGSADAVAALLDAGADIRRADAHGHEALHVAAAVSDPPPDASVVKCLLARGADPNVLVPGKGPRRHPWHCGAAGGLPRHRPRPGLLLHRCARPFSVGRGSASLS